MIWEMPTVHEVPQPDESGADAFERFRYQAHVAFLFCLACWRSEDGIKAVYCEHFEDLLIEYADRLRFIAIKTRNPEYGPWRLQDLSRASGAFRSLLRTFNAVRDSGDPRPIILEARLEGAIRRGDPLEALKPPRPDPLPNELMEACTKPLGLEKAEVETFLAHVVVQDRAPARDVIRGGNLETFMRLYPRATAEQISAAYDASIALLESAMTADVLADQWPAAVLSSPDTLGEELARRAEAKRLDAMRLATALDGLSGQEATLLTAVLDPEFLEATALEGKLVAAGANPTTILRAKEMRARAGIHLASLQARSRESHDERLEDIRQRLLTTADAVAASSGAGHADGVWLGVLDRLRQQPAAFDPSGVFAQDPLLLAGHVCQLSDECQFGWGGSS